MSFVWSPAAVDQLHHLYVQEGLSAAETARRLGAGVTRNAVLGKAQRMGWTRPAPVRPPRLALKAAPARPAATRRLTRAPFQGRLPLPKLREVPASTAPRLWTERGEGECAYPVGEAVQAGLQFSCCAPTGPGSAYCPAHRALMLLPGTGLSPREQDAIVNIARKAA